MSNVRLCVLQWDFVVVVRRALSSSSIDVVDDWAAAITERGDPQGRMSERGWVVDNETVALDEWLIVIGNVCVCCTYSDGKEGYAPTIAHCVDAEC